ncbi:MAG: hypothetical protein LBR87_03135 [Synergistaceae bacterium]|jgi:hypothetical protein|nr:hypothetical protein [Synergistaceae bacterium]
MTRIREFLSEREFRRPLAICAASAAIWLFSLTLLSFSVESAARTDFSLSSAGRLLDSAMKFKALPRAGRNTSAGSDDQLGAVSQIVDALELRDKIRQLQSNPSGVLIQLDGIYGDELRDFLFSAENRGLSIIASEIRALPDSGERVLSVTFMLEPGG